MAAAAVAAAAIVKHFKYNLRFGTRRRESLEESSFSFLRNHSADAICQHRAVYNYGMRPCLSESVIHCLVLGLN